MSRLKMIGFGAFLVLGVSAAVASLVAQGTTAPRRWVLDGPGSVLMLDGRGGQLGVTVRELDAEGLKAAAGAPGGVRIQDVDSDGPAAKAGIQTGDIVIDVDGDRVRSTRQFSRLIQETPDGRSVRLGIVRNGQRQTVEVTPQSRPSWGFDGDLIGREVERSLRDVEPRLREFGPNWRELEPRLRELDPQLREFHFDAPRFDMWMPRFTNPRARLGVQTESLTPQLGEYFGATDGGVLVSSVTADSPAQKAGLKAGDVITSVNGVRVRGYNDLLDQLRGVEGGEVSVGIVRDKKASTIKVTIESAASRRPGRPV